MTKQQKMSSASVQTLPKPRVDRALCKVLLKYLKRELKRDLKDIEYSLMGILSLNDRLVYERKYAELCDLIDEFEGKGKKYLLKVLLKRLYKDADEIEEEMDADDITNGELAKLDSEWNQIDQMISQVEEQLEARR